MSQNDEQDFVNIKIWNLFRNRFKSSVTEASYWSDITEFCRFTGKQFDTAGRKDVERYYRMMGKKVEEGKDQSSDFDEKIQGTSFFCQFSDGRGVCIW